MSLLRRLAAIVVLALALTGRTSGQSDARRVFVLDTREGTAPAEIIVVDPVAKTIVIRIRTGIAPNISLSPDGRIIYSAESVQQGGSLRDRMVAYSAADGKELRSTPLASRLRYTVLPQRGAVQADQNRVFVAEMGSADANALDDGGHSSWITVLKAATLQPEARIPTGRSILLAPLANQPPAILDSQQNRQRVVTLDAASPQRRVETTISARGVPSIAGEVAFPSAEFASAVVVAPRRLVAASIDTLELINLAEGLDRLADTKPLIAPRPQQQLATWTLASDAGNQRVGIGLTDSSGMMTRYRVFRTRDWQQVADFAFPAGADILDVALSADGTLAYATDAKQHQLLVYNLDKPGAPTAIPGMGAFPAQIIVGR